MDLMRMDFASKWNRMMSWVAVAVLIALTTGAVFLILGKLRDLQP
jgi:branched-subunit amino acid transport protein